MDLKLWEYIFEMFNYKIRQKKSIFSKLQTLTLPLKHLEILQTRNIVFRLQHIKFFQFNLITSKV